jgi:hypothetical protein
MNNEVTPQSDVFTYHSVNELQAMELRDVQALWELVPTDRQRQYKVILDRFLRSQGAAGTDAAEMSAIRQILDKYYVEEHMVPVLPTGDIWVKVPKQVREAAQNNVELARADIASEPAFRKPPKGFLFLGAVCILALGVLMVRNISMRSSRNADSVGTMSASTRPSITPIYSPTPTPLALQAQDEIIRSGDAGRAVSSIYPVNLRVVQNTSQPRVFVVQRRSVMTTEWNYEDNPDTASYIAGLIVRPVLGIPWSTDNATLFEGMDTGTEFLLQMNTGSVQRFAFESQEVVSRSDTEMFRQNAPGLVLVLIGERNEETGEPTVNRMVVVARYAAEGELASGMVTGVELPQVATPTLTPAATLAPRNLNVQLISVTTKDEVASFRLRIFNPRNDAVQLDGNAIAVVYGYEPRPVGPRVAAEIQPFDLLPGQAVDLTVNMRWNEEPFAMLNVFDEYKFAIEFTEW